jgi:hypothetical protein
VLVRGAGFPFSWLDEVLHAKDPSRALREVAATPSFREAVTWQNRAAVVDGLDSLLRKPEGAHDAKTRKKELLVVRYLQRYAAKNDTIGFFGPVGWARWGDAGRWRPSEALVAARAVFAEPWMARVLADTVTTSDEGRAKALLSLPGDLRVVGRVLVTPTERVRVSALEAQVLRRLQERGPMRGGPLVKGLGREAKAAVERLAAQHVVRWTYPVAISHQPLAAVAELPGAEAVVQGLRALDSLSRARVSLAAPLRAAAPPRRSARVVRSLHAPAASSAEAGAPHGRATPDAVSQCSPGGVGLPAGAAPRRVAGVGSPAGAEPSARGLAPGDPLPGRWDPDAVGEHLAVLERAFTAATAHAPSRHAGRTYGGRGLVYEECRRAVDLELSDAMRARVAAPLALLLQVARWYTFTIAKRFVAACERLVERPVPLHVLWARTAPLFEGTAPRAIAPTEKELHRRWRATWGDATERSVTELAPVVARRFAAPCPGWPGARHHAPDLLWEVASAEAMLRGEGTPVLGELHPGVTPFTTLSVLAHAPDRAELEAQWEADLGLDGLTPIPWEDFARSTQDARLSRRHWHLDLGFDFQSDRPAARVLRAADFDVRRVSGRLQVVHRARPLRFELLQVFERRLKLLAATAFSLGDGAPRGPRRTLDGLVIQRAHWRFDQAALAWLEEPVGRVERAAAFRAAHDLPRRVFVRSPEEVKPLYVDLEAPLLLEVLARLGRQAPWLAFSEMLPGPEGLWLRDARGAPYVCELRCLAVDPVPFDAARVR